MKTGSEKGGDAVFPEGNCRTFTIGISLIPFNLGHVLPVSANHGLA